MNTLKVGDLVVILKDLPSGIEDEDEFNCNGEVGEIIEYNEDRDMYLVSTNDFVATDWWWFEDDLRLANTEEIVEKLRKILKGE